jgi:DNA repair photolyase
MNGKAIYQPAGAAAEYAKYACNFYTGCSNDCAYCYCKKGVMARTWSTTPKLKKCFKSEGHALKVFEKELKANLSELRKHGLFFSFTTDPMLFDRSGYENPLILVAINKCVFHSVPVKILTKRADFFDKAWGYTIRNCTEKFKTHVAFGFTLTGHGELEPGASPNSERIQAMRKLHEAGFLTWASIEPVINFENSFNMIDESYKFCDLYKIGLLSGKEYDFGDLCSFVEDIYKTYRNKIYFKEGLLAQTDIVRSTLPANCVDRDYSLFNNQQS